MDSEALERLELKIAFLERANSELSDVVYKQQQELTEVKDRLDALTGRVDAFKGDTHRAMPDARPPNY